MEFFNKAFVIIKDRLLDGDVSTGHIPKRLGNSSVINHKVFGLFIGDAFMQCGAIFAPFSEWFYQYLLDPEDVDVVKTMVLKSQVPKDAASAAFHSFIDDLDNAETNDTINQLLDVPENMERVNGTQWSPYETVNLETKERFIKELIFDELVAKRYRQLQAFREGLKFSGLLSWMKKNPKLCKDIFVQGSELDIMPYFLQAIKAAGPQSEKVKADVISWFDDYIRTSNKSTIKELFTFTTAMERLPPWGLLNPIKLEFHEDTEEHIYPSSNVCFNMLNLPVVHTSKSVFIHHINKALSIEGSGFSAIE